MYVLAGLVIYLRGLGLKAAVLGVAGFVSYLLLMLFNVSRLNVSLKVTDDAIESVSFVGMRYRLESSEVVELQSE